MVAYVTQLCVNMTTSRVKVNSAALWERVINEDMFLEIDFLGEVDSEMTA